MFFRPFRFVAVLGVNAAAPDEHDGDVHGIGAVLAADFGVRFAPLLVLVSADEFAPRQKSVQKVCFLPIRFFVFV